jgi:hypothetical protein
MVLNKLLKHQNRYMTIEFYVTDADVNLIKMQHRSIFQAALKEIRKNDNLFLK